MLPTSAKYPPRQNGGGKGKYIWWFVLGFIILACLVSLTISLTQLYNMQQMRQKKRPSKILDFGLNSIRQDVKTLSQDESAIPAVPVIAYPRKISLHRVGTNEPFATANLESADGALDFVLEHAKNELKDNVRLFTHLGVPVEDIAQVVEHVFCLIGDEHWVWPGVALGHNVTLHLETNPNLFMKTVSLEPKIFYLEDFLTQDECDKIIAHAKTRMVRSTVATNDGNAVSDVRTSSYAWIGPGQLGEMVSVRNKVAELIRVPMELAEDMQVLEYQKGQHYHSHHDYFDPAYYADPSLKTGANRFITVFFYLTTVHQGGETVFPYSGDDTPVRDFKDCSRGLRVKPVKGHAVLWYNLKAIGHMEGALDYKSLHGGCDPLANEEKWGANYWVRNKH